MANDMPSSSTSDSIDASHAASLSQEVPSPAKAVETQANATAHATMNESPAVGASCTGSKAIDTTSASAFACASSAISHVIPEAPSPVKTNETTGAIVVDDSTLPHDTVVAELARLGPLPRAFFDSQGILDVEGFLAHSARSLAPELADFRADNGLEKQALPKLRCCIRRWRRDVLQRRKTLTEEVQGLHPAFEIFEGTVRSFLTAKSIIGHQDLLKYRGLGREWVAWRVESNLTDVNPTTAYQVTSAWRTSVQEQLEIPFPPGSTAVTRQEAESTAPVNPEQIQRPVKKRRLHRMVAIRTSPWLSLGVVSAVATHAQERRDTTGASPSAEKEADGASAATGDIGTANAIGNSPPAQKRARLEKTDAQRVSAG